MTMQRTAVGYMRTDVSGASEKWDGANLHSAAINLDLDLRKIIAFDQHVERPIRRLRVQLSRLRACTLIVPSLDHLGGTIPSAIREQVDVITLSPEATYERLSVSPVVFLHDKTYAVSLQLDALLTSADEIATAAGSFSAGLDHLLLAMLRNPEFVALQLRRLGLTSAVFGERLETLIVGYSI
ncbi:hypothetical protein ACIP5Y_21870 [Nocardia sp. NPDC088792]|uniref:hypothetical protein n=1 Tax=Nocardia sp. NPDC088792 TaxID=3364332 RepID=UPI00382A6673